MLIKACLFIMHSPQPLVPKPQKPPPNIVSSTRCRLHVKIVTIFITNQYKRKKAYVIPSVLERNIVETTIWRDL